MDMANIKHFADTATGTISFDRVDFVSRKDIRGFDPVTKAWVKVTRSVTYKSFASKHECDARCMNASGRTMQCECACGGKNHGRGFVAETA
jgi:hypothetical protein